MPIRGVIFDLDGVIVLTDEFHYQGWKRIADEEGIRFDRKINDRLRGVSRMDSLDILLEEAPKEYSDGEKKEMADRKNGYYRELLGNLTPNDILAGVMDVLNDLRSRGVKLAVGSSSRNSPTILKRIGLADYFDVTSDGNDIKNSKPDPEVFLIASERMGLKPEDILVVEDAGAGIEAAIRGGMRVLAVGSANGDKRAHLSARDMASITVDDMLDCADEELV